MSNAAETAMTQKEAAGNGLLVFDMEIHVMKFGGSSLGTPEKIRNTARKAVEKRRHGIMPVLVVSAPADMTDDLIALGRQCAGNISPREYDALISCGEQISAALCAAAISDEGFQARSFTGRQAGILTDSTFGNAKVLDFAPDTVIDAIDNGIIPVITGFQGADLDGNVATLGRGGSDLTAVMAADMLNAALCEFYTDVKGIYDSHPGIVPDAATMPLISYSEILALGEKGTTVRQLRAIRYAMSHNLRLSLRSSFVDEPGTVIAATGRQGINALSFQKKDGVAEISAIGYEMSDGDYTKFSNVALEGDADSVFRENLNFSDCETVVFCAKIQAEKGETLLKHLHKELLQHG